MHRGEDVWPLGTEDKHDSMPQPGHQGNGHVPHGLESGFDVVSGIDGESEFEELDKVGGSAQAEEI